MILRALIFYFLLVFVVLQAQSQHDSIPQIKNSIRFYGTDLIMQKVSFGYQRNLKNNRIAEFDAFYKFNSNMAGSAELWKNNIYYKSNGFETRFGIGKTKTFLNTSLTQSFLISYRYQYTPITIFQAPFKKNIPDAGFYWIAQTRNAIGFFYKINLRKNKLNCFELFFLPGIYLTHTKNSYHGYRGDGNYSSWIKPAIYDKSQYPDLKTWYMKDGSTILPYINGGISYRISNFKNKNKIPLKTKTKSDSTSKTIYLNINLTSLLANRLIFSIEQKLNYNHSHEFDFTYLYDKGIADPFTNAFVTNGAFNSRGVEFRYGLNYWKSKNDNDIVTRGWFVSYRYQHTSHKGLNTGGLSGSSQNPFYNYSQTKNLIGIFHKWCWFNGKKTSLQLYFAPGLYVGYSRTVVFKKWLYGSTYYYGYPSNNIDLYWPNGICVIPNFRLGVALKLKVKN